jgi:hypothetical protein
MFKIFCQRIRVRRTFLFVLLLQLALNSFASNLDCNAHHCVAVIDAGSTKSYLHLYQYDLDETQTPVHIEEKWTHHVKPGLATLEVQQIPHYLDELFNTLTVTKTLPVYLYATAGMRLLSTANQEKLYRAAKHWFTTHPDFEIKEAKTITGTDEGVYGWVAANYQLGKFNPQEKTMGVMDMGGASVEVAFPVSNASGILSQDYITLHLYGQTIHLFVHSFLGLGQTEVIHQLMDEPGCYARGYPLPNQTVATGIATECTQKADLLLQVHDVFKTVQPILSKNLVEDWFVMGGLSALAKSYTFHFINEKINPQALLEEGVPTLCQTTWQELSLSYPNDPYLATSCLASSYFYALLVDGYGLNPKQEIQFSHDEATDDWTLGVVLVH